MMPIAAREIDDGQSEWIQRGDSAFAGNRRPDEITIVTDGAFIFISHLISPQLTSFQHLYEISSYYKEDKKYQSVQSFIPFALNNYQTS